MFSIFWSKQKLFRGKEDLTIINISLFNSFKCRTSYPQFFRCIWHPLLYNFPSEPQVSLEMRQHPESQCFVVLQCLRSTATTPCLNFFDVELFFPKKSWKLLIKMHLTLLTHTFFSSCHTQTCTHFRPNHKRDQFQIFH